MNNKAENTGISQKAIIFNKESKFLTIRRSATAPACPFCWDLPGGDLDFGENAFQGIIREIKEESGLEVADIIPFDIHYYINGKGEPWITIAYKGECISDEVTLSYEHDQYKWVTPEEFLKLKSREKLQQFVKNYISKKNNGDI